MTSVLKKVFVVVPKQQQQQQQQCNNATSSSISDNNNHNVRILACSVVHDKTFFEYVDRQLCEDRKHFVEHLKPANFAKSTIRLTLTQATLSLSNYMNDQLKYDLELDERVEQGEITRAEADLESEEWEQREWTKRWSLFPEKLLWAVCKFQSIVLVMRIYEYIASQICTLETLDKLTQDTFKTAQRLVTKEGGRENLSSEQKLEVGKQMFVISKDASIIAYLADFSVHQILLGYGYYVFMKERRKYQLRAKRQEEKDEEEKKDRIQGGEEEIMTDGAFAFSLLKRSTLLAVSRGVGLISASAGGALGTIIWPGWGTLAGTNLGDSLAGVCMDELNIGSVTAPTIK